MRMPQKTGLDLSTAHSLRREPNVTYHVSFWRQPIHRWLIFKAYHWYDAHIYKVPGFKALEKFLQRRHRDDFFYIPLGAQQDEKCYFYSSKQRVVLATVEVDEETYNKIKDVLYGSL